MVSKGRIDGVLVLLESVLVVVSVNSELELVLDRLAALADNILKFTDDGETFVSELL